MTYGAGSLASRRQAIWARSGSTARWTSAIRQSGLPAGIVVALVVLTAAAPLEAAGGRVVVLLTVFAVMVSAAAAVLAAVSAPLAGSPLLGWLALLLGGYSLVVLPLSSGVLSPAPSPAAGTGAAPDAEVVFAALRLVALLVIALAVLALTRGTLRSAHRQRGELANRLASAVEARRRLAERAEHRDHEIRNGLSGLAGIGELIRSSAAVRERDRLRAAVERELARLQTILRRAEPAAGLRLPRPE
ncbi:MAG TPA: hypothetical protein VNO83_07790 [Pseudonocardia sp.]|nr:hypothetical protein [Pseudonocardia sp.]